MNRKNIHISGSGGFSLIELLIVIAIIGIIAAIAYPSYERSIMRSNRSEAKTALSQDAQILERCYTKFFSYTPAAPNTCPTITGATQNSFYNITTPTLSATSYVIAATADAAHRQHKDSDCQVFMLDNTGNKTAKNGAGTTSTTINATCWGG